jgi:hypothetical protein
VHRCACSHRQSPSGGDRKQEDKKWRLDSQYKVQVSNENTTKRNSKNTVLMVAIIKEYEK